MKNLLGIVTFLLVGIVATVPAQAQTKYDYEVTRVTDGDTIRVKAPWLPKELGDDIALRIVGIDTPEKGGRAKCTAEAKLGDKATEYAKATIKPGQIVQVVLVSWDKYGGRIDAHVYINGVSFADMQIREGLAVPYDGGTKSPWCK